MPLLILGSCLLLLAAVFAFVGVSYQPESTPLTPAQPPAFRVVAKSVAVGGVLLFGLGALGFGGFLVAAVTVVAIGVARL